MRHATRMVRDFEVIPLCDAVGPMGEALRKPILETFIGASPDHFDSDVWVMHFHCYLLRREAAPLVLVDAGIGGASSPAATWAPVPGALQAELSRSGVAPADIAVVVLTHLHSDHVGGAVDDAGRPTFPNARYVLQRAELEWISAHSPNPILDEMVPRLRDLIQVVEGTAEIIPGITVHHTPGHTPGHQVAAAGDLTIAGDLVLHPVQIAEPGITYVYDEDPQLAVESRRALLQQLRARGGTIAMAHGSEPFVDLAP